MLILAGSLYQQRVTQHVEDLLAVDFFGGGGGGGGLGGKLRNRILFASERGCQRAGSFLLETRFR